MKILLRIVAWALNIVVAVALLASCWAGHVDPRWLPIAAVVAMLPPLTVPLAVLVFVADCIWWRKFAIGMGLCLVVCGGSALQTFPVNIPHKAPDKDDPAVKSFTLLTYNLMNFVNQNDVYPDDTNPTMSYILRTDADVVCLQEATYFFVNDKVHITAAQMDSLRIRYPHIYVDGEMSCIFSKFPVKKLDVTPMNSKIKSGNDIAGYVLDIYGQRLAIYNVHLRSFGLTYADKELYQDLTKLKGLKKGRDELSLVKTELVSKIEDAAINRAAQVETLVRDINRTGGQNVVVCGDFNDVPGCWATNRLKDIDLHPTWPQVGLGYLRTYNKNRFYFQIDHVLWRGVFRPVRMDRGDVRMSDHFPLLTTFVLEDES